MNEDPQCERLAYQALDRQLLQSQQKVREEMNRRTEAILSFSRTTGSSGSFSGVHISSASGIENTVQYVEKALIGSVPVFLENSLTNEYSVPNQFKNHEIAPHYQTETENEVTNEVLSCDCW